MIKLRVTYNFVPGIVCQTICYTPFQILLRALLKLQLLLQYIYFRKNTVGMQG